jgi:uncharacterized protein
MKRSIIWHAALFVVGTTLLLSGCSSLLAPRRDESKFYVLSPLPESEAPAGANASALAIAIGPVRFPDYLLRLQIATRANSNRINYSEFDRWAEPLETTFVRVLSQNLSILLGTSRVVEVPGFALAKYDYEIPMQVMQFECDATGTAHLAARWRVERGTGGKVLSAKESRITTNPAVGASGTEACVSTLSHALADLSREVAAEVRLSER